MATEKTQTVAGKKTASGDLVHYTDHSGVRHAARIEKLATDGAAHLRVFHSTNGSDATPLEHVPHSHATAPHTWTHFPE